MLNIHKEVRNNMNAEQYVEDTAKVHEFATEVARILADTAVPEFSSEPITVEDASKLIGVPEGSIRAGIQYGWLPIGIAVNNGKVITGKSNARATFIIFPRKIWETTGHIWKGKAAL